MVPPPCQAASVSVTVKSSMMDPTTSSANSWGNLMVMRPILKQEQRDDISSGDKKCVHCTCTHYLMAVCLNYTDKLIDLE